METGSGSGLLDNADMPPLTHGGDIYAGHWAALLVYVGATPIHCIPPPPPPCGFRGSMGKRRRAVSALSSGFSQIRMYVETEVLSFGNAHLPIMVGRIFQILATYTTGQGGEHCVICLSDVH